MITENVEVKTMQVQKKSWKPVAGGILILIASVFCLPASLVAASIVDVDVLLRLVPFLFLLFGFGIGLAAGICALKRVHFAFTMIGCSFVIVGGVLGSFIGWTVLLGLVILPLAILGTIFIVAAKGEFI